MRKHLYKEDECRKLGKNIGLVFHKCIYCGESSTFSRELLKDVDIHLAECENGKEMGFWESFFAHLSGSVNCLE